MQGFLRARVLAEYHRRTPGKLGQSNTSDLALQCPPVPLSPPRHKDGKEGVAGSSPAALQIAESRLLRRHQGGSEGARRVHVLPAATRSFPRAASRAARRVPRRGQLHPGGIARTSLRSPPARSTKRHPFSRGRRACTSGVASKRPCVALSTRASLQGGPENCTLTGMSSASNPARTEQAGSPTRSCGAV